MCVLIVLQPPQSGFFLPFSPLPKLAAAFMARNFKPLHTQSVRLPYRESEAQISQIFSFSYRRIDKGFQICRNIHDNFLFSNRSLGEFITIYFLARSPVGKAHLLAQHVIEYVTGCRTRTHAHNSFDCTAQTDRQTERNINWAPAVLRSVSYD